MEPLDTTSKVLFVRNLPYSTTDQELEDSFGEYGPLKRCFVVKDKTSDSKCRGFGYVTFALKEDAERVLSADIKIKDRLLQVSLAKKRDRKKASEIEVTDAAPEIKIEKKKKDKVVKKAPDAHKRTIVITGLNASVTSNSIETLCKKYGAVEHADIHSSNTYELHDAHVCFSNYKDAVRAFQKINGLTFDGTTIWSHLLSQEQQKVSQKRLQQSRVIIRNLKFDCTADDVKAVCIKYGPVHNVHMPTKEKDGKQRSAGFCFVEFKSIPVAKQAIKLMNGQEIKGRQVVVDWAVAQDKYQEKVGKNQSLRKSKDTVPPISDTSSKPSPSDAGGGNDQNQQEDSDGEEGDSEVVKGDSGNDEGDSGSGEDDRENVSDSESGEGESGSGSVDDESESGKNDSDEEGLGSEEEASSGKGKKSGTKSHTEKQKTEDVQEGKTVFIRNLPFNSDEEELSELFCQFGEVIYGKIVVNPSTGHSRGTGFVKFKSAEEAEYCINEVEKRAAQNNSLSLRGRDLSVVKAVAKGDLDKLEKSKNTEKKKVDARNMYLATVGIVLKDAEEKKQLDAKDLQRREKAWAEKKSKLKNVNMFVSKTRICVRNLPLKIDDKKLKESIHKVCHIPLKNIVQCKVMRSKDSVEEGGLGKSLGFAFVEFREHEDAMKTVQQFNNNVEIFGASRRLIVDFSVENKLILNMRQQRLERSRATLKEREIQGATKNLKFRQEKARRPSKLNTEERNVKPKKDGNKLEGKSRDNISKRKDFKKDNQKSGSVTSQVKPSADSRKRAHTEEGKEERKNYKKQSHTDIAKPSPPAAKKIKKTRNLPYKNDEKNEEQEFRKMVEKYQNKLFANTSSASQGSRWFELDSL